MSTTKDFPLAAELKDAVDILKMDTVKMAAIAKRESATKWGIIILMVPFVVNLIIYSIDSPSTFMSAITSKFVFWRISIPILAIVASTFITSFIAERFFNGKGTHLGFFRVIAYASVASWLTMIGFFIALIGGSSSLIILFSIIASIWILFVMYNSLIVLHKLNQQDAILSLAGGIVGYLVLQALLGSVLIGGSYRYY
jgi:Yip1-like protein